MVSKNNCKRKSSRVTVKTYIPKLPFEIREELDLFDDNTYWDSWIGFYDHDFMRREKYQKSKILKQTRQFILKSIWKRERQIKYDLNQTKIRCDYFYNTKFETF